MKKIILILLVLIAAGSEAQVSQQWASIFNGSGFPDESVAIVLDGAGNIIVTGSSVGTGGNNNFGTVKYNSSGIQQWAKFYNGPSNNYDESIGLVADASGNIYVAGMSLNTTTNYDIVLVKYNPAGDQLWAKEWNSSAGLKDEPFSIAIDNSANILITGYTEISGFNTNYITLKYNSSGILQWAKEYNNPINNSDIAYVVEGDPAGNVYVTGTSVAQTTGSDFLTIKYSPSGDSNWVRRYSGTTDINEIPYGLAVDASGNCYIAGFTKGPSNSIDFATIKYSTAGAQQWVAIYDSTHGQDIPEDVEVDGSGNVYVTGRTRINSTYNDFATIKYNSAGVRQWIAVYDNIPESRDDYGYDVEVDASGNVYVTGNSQAGGSDRDALTIKYNNAGVQQWLARYDVTNSEETYVLALDNSNNVYVTGYQSSGGGSDFLTIKYSQTIGINQISSEVPEKFTLHQNYPNPFNPVTNLEFGISLASRSGNLEFVSLNIYDATGRKIETLVNEKLSAGVYKVDFNGNGLSSGTYFYRLEAGNFVETKKMILLK